MSTQAQSKNQERAVEQARSQLAGVVEMVERLTEEGAIQQFLRGQSDADLRGMLEGADLLGDGIGWSEESLREDVARFIRDGDLAPAEWQWDEDEARQAIQDDALSVEVRSGWYSPGADEDERRPEEFAILLCTGGPAVRIVGRLDGHGEPERAWIEYQDWFTPWQELVDVTSEERDALLEYARQFYFGE